MSVKISIIIPCRNERPHIADFLDSLLSQELDAGWQTEVLVADGMSEDGTREILAEYRRRAPQVHLIDNPGRIVSTGLNAAIRAASGDVIIRMDAHTTYGQDYIRQCVQVLQESGADNVGGPWVAKGRGPIGEAIAAAFRSPFCAGRGKSHDPSYEGEVDTVYLGCWFRSVFEKAGLFDTDLVRNQDDEFNFRLRRLGGLVWQSPRICSSYTPRASLSALFRQYLQYGFWRVAVIRKHRALAAWRQAVPALFLSSLLVLALLSVMSGLIGLTNLSLLATTFLAVELFLYALLCIAAALPFVRSLDPLVLFLLPGVIAVYHVAYGLGFLIGVLQLHHRASARLFTQLTR